MFEVSNLQAWYGNTQALFDVNLTVRRGGALALVGLNGAGKSTIVRAIAGIVRTQGSITADGAEIGGLEPHQRVRQHGLAVVHEGRGLFPRMTVRENLTVGLSGRRARDLDKALSIFPALGPRLSDGVADLSGGQQQMVAIGRAVLRDPQLLLLDEPALGLSPVAIAEIYEQLVALRSTGTTVVIVDQNISRVAQLVDELCLIRTGVSSIPVSASSEAAVYQLEAMIMGGDGLAERSTG